jgi:hypothetical protein
LNAGALHSFDDDPSQAGRPQRANQNGEKLDEKQLDTSAEKKATAIS